MPAKGINGTMSISGTFVVIERGGGFRTLATQGLKGEKRIPLSSVTSVQFKGATHMTSGYLQIGLLGASESKGGYIAAASDENTVSFFIKHQRFFEPMRDYILAQIGRTEEAEATAPGFAAQLQQLASLRDQGILSEDEFQTKKAEILARL